MNIMKRAKLALSGEQGGPSVEKHDDRLHSHSSVE